MKSIDRDEFIYNYFEDNLSPSELELFRELKETDLEFADQVNNWNATYFNKEIRDVEFSRKELIYKNDRKWIVGGAFLLMTSVIVYLFNSNYQLNERTERIENELLNNKKTEKLERKETNSVDFNVKGVETVPPVFITEHLPISLPRSFKNEPVKSIRPRNKEEVEILVVIDSTVKENVTKDVATDTVMLSVDTLSMNLDSAVSVEEEPNKEPSKAKKAKKMRRVAKWSDIKKVYKNQKVVPLE